MLELAEWSRHVFSGMSLDAAGLIALTDLATIARRTALTGQACYADSLVLCPGIHRQSDALRLNIGEYPIAANIISGYVFRIENQVTVNFLQTVGRTGCLVTLAVDKDRAALASLRWLVDLSGHIKSTMLYLLTIILTILSLALLIAFEDFWGFGILMIPVGARLATTVSIKRRCSTGWHGAPEPDTHGSLLILLSQDRWIRLDGQVDDLKAVTSGQWLHDNTFVDECLEGIATTIVYLSAALATNATQAGKILMASLMLVNAGVLSVSNSMRKTLYMKEFVISSAHHVRKYGRRLDLAHELIEECKRDDWAVKLGMILEPVLSEKSKSDECARVNIKTVQV